MSQIPVVQGTYVQSDDGGDPYNKSSYHNANANANATTYNANATAENQSTTIHFNNDRHEQQQPKQFRDAIWAVAFILHLCAMFVVITMNITAGGGGDNGDNGKALLGGPLFLFGATVAASVAISTATISLMMRYPAEMVKAALIFSTVLMLAISISSFLSGSIFMGCITLFCFAINVCYAKLVWPRIPFAAANLNTALTAVKANMGLAVVGYFMMILAFGWTAFWLMGLASSLESSNGGIVFLLLVSYYWVHQVIGNTFHVTTAGTVGTWWFVPGEANGCCSTAIQDSFCRATTYSFGSICLGSLLVAIVQALRALAHQARQNEDMQLLLCLIECILACIADIVDYFNQWAYVYVGLYGFGYIDAGRNVFQLFQQKGWTVIISDDLTARVLTMVSFGVGVLTGLVGLSIALADKNMFADLGFEGSAAFVGFFIGLVVGMVFCSILMNVVGSAVNTVIVCFAESPAEFEQNHPQLSAEMRSAWIQSWPELTI